MIFAVLAVFATASIFAQESENSSSHSQKNEANKNEAKWSTLSYVNVPILKILEGKDAYVVAYQKNKVGVGNVVIPKKWTEGDPNTPRKLKFRKVNGSKDSYMTVVKKDGEFLRVILSVPMTKSNPIWGVADYHKDIEGSDKDTLEELEF